MKSHIKFGLWALAVYATIGLVLEGMNGFKLGWYVTGETRRTLLTLGHAHGVGLAMWNVVFGMLDPKLKRPKLASGTLRAATVLLPGGFLLGGIWVYGGDPGLGFVLIPVGAVLLITSVVVTALGYS